MPHKHDPAKTFLNILVPRELFYRIDQYVKFLGVSRSSWMNELLEKEMDRLGIELTEDNTQKCRDETIALKKRRGMAYDGGVSFIPIKKVLKKK